MERKMPIQNFYKGNNSTVTNDVQERQQSQSLRLPSSRFSVRDMKGAPPSQCSIDSPPQQLRENKNHVDNKNSKRVEMMKNIRKCPQNCMATTHSTFPMSKKILKGSSVNFGVIVEALPKLKQEIPLVDCGSSVVVRCKKCRGYINPFVIFDSDSTWICNFCNTKNNLPAFFAMESEEKNGDLAKKQRPELNSCVYEIVAPREYSNRPPQTPNFLFLIDVTVEAINCGMLYEVSCALSEAISGLKGKPRVKVAIITFDSTLQFYRFKKPGSEPEIVVSPDLDAICMPPVDELLVEISEFYDEIKSTIENLPRLHEKNNRNDVALGTLLEVVSSSFQNVGGKIHLFTASNNYVNPGAIPPPSVEFQRINISVLSTAKTKKVFNEALKALTDDPQNFYKRKGQELNDKYFSIDVSLFTRNKMIANAAALGKLTQNTGGKFTLYEILPIAKQKYSKELTGELKRRLEMPSAWEAVMRLRVSSKLRIKNEMGNFHLKCGDLISYPVAHSGQSVSANIQFETDDDDPVVFNNFVFLQSALLFTSEDGRRLIRVYNTAIPTATSIKQFIESTNCDVFTAFTAKLAAERAMKFDQRAARNLIQSSGLNVAKQMSIHCRKPGQNFQKPEDLPEKVKRMSLMVLGLLKSNAFCEASLHPELHKNLKKFISTQLRYQNLSFVYNATISELQLYSYPKAFSLLDLLCSEDFSEGESLEELFEETRRPLSSLASINCPVLAICNAQHLWLRVRKDCPSEALQYLFGVEAIEKESELELNILPESPLGSRIEILLNYLRSASAAKWLEPCVVVEGDTKEKECWELLYEERTDSVMSFEEFSKYIVKVINNPL